MLSNLSEMLDFLQKRTPGHEKTRGSEGSGVKFRAFPDKSSHNMEIGDQAFLFAVGQAAVDLAHRTEPDTHLIQHRFALDDHPLTAAVLRDTQTDALSQIGAEDQGHTVHLILCGLGVVDVFMVDLQDLVQNRYTGRGVVQHLPEAGGILHRSGGKIFTAFSCSILYLHISSVLSLGGLPE